MGFPHRVEIMRRHRAIEVYRLAVRRKRAAEFILRRGNNSFGDNARLVGSVVADKIAQIMEELPFSFVVPMPNLDAARLPAALARWRLHRARPMITDEREIARREDLFRLEINTSLAVVGGE